MAFGNFTKQLAKQAMGEKMKDVVDSLRPADASKISENLPAPKAAAPVQEANIAAMIVGQVQAMQNALKEEDELVVLCTVGLETLRVLEFYTPSPELMVLTGFDTEKTITRLISSPRALQVVCKPMSVQPPAKPVRIRFITSRPKSE